MPDSAAPIELEDLLAESGWVRSLVHGLVKDADLAEDVLQETWLRAIRSRPAAVHGKPSIRRWLAVVARRIAARWASSDAARRRREREAARAPTCDPEDLTDRVRLQREVATHVLALDELHRTAVVLRYQEGLSPREIARKLGISDQAARQRVSRGLARLRERMEREHGPGRNGWVAALLPLIATDATPAPLAAPAGAWPWLGAFAGLAALAWLGWFLVDHDPNAPPTPTVTEHVTRDDSSTGAPAEPTRESVPSRPDRAGEATAASTEPPPIDRERDLHGRVIDADAQPITGASVTARVVNHSAYGLAAVAMTPALASTITDSTGAFRVRLERDTAVDLWISAEGSGSEVLPDRRAGEHVEVTLLPAARLTGRIHDHTGSVVAGAQLRLVRLWPDTGVAREMYRGVSGVDGTFDVEGLPSGRAVLEVESTKGPSRPSVVTMTAGAAIDCSVTIVPCEPLRGSVVDATTGHPIAGARITRGPAFATGSAKVHRLRPSHLGRSWATIPAVASQADGDFVVHVPTDYTHTQLHVSAPGYAGTAKRVPSPRPKHLRVELSRGWSLRGTLVDRDRQPLGQTRVTATATGAGDGIEQGDWRSTTTDDAGRFEFETLRPDLHYRLRADEDEHGHALAGSCGPQRGSRDLGEVVVDDDTTVLRGVVATADGSPQSDIYITVTDSNGHSQNVRSDDLGRFTASHVARGNVTVTAGARQTQVLVPATGAPELLQLELPADGVHGIVTDALGTPIHNALVLLIPADRAARPQRFVTDPTGRFTFPNVPFASYGITVAPNSIHLPGGDRMVHQVHHDDVTPSAADLRIVLPPAAVTLGQVHDSTGAPQARTLVFARDDDGRLVTYEVTDENGNFVLRLPPGSTVNLAIGRDHPKRIVHRGVTAGARNVHITTPN